MKTYLKTFFHGCVFFLGIATTALVATTVPSLWNSGDTITASHLNDMVNAIYELQSSMNTIGFGSRVTQSSDTIYQAATDGFVTATCNSGAYFQVETGTTSPPTTIMAHVESQVGSANQGAVTIPIIKNHYYRVTRVGGCGPTVFWTPRGN